MPVHDNRNVFIVQDIGKEHSDQVKGGPKGGFFDTGVSCSTSICYSFHPWGTRPIVKFKK